MFHVTSGSEGSFQDWKNPSGFFSASEASKLVREAIFLYPKKRHTPMIWHIKWQNIGSRSPAPSDSDSDAHREFGNLQQEKSTREYDDLQLQIYHLG